MAKFFKNPFAMSGDKASIPEPVKGSGEVSYVEGFGFDYERDQTSDPLAKAVPRDQSNELYYQITLALQQYQTNGFPDFITTADNGGTPYSYGLAAYVRYDDGGGFAVYESIVGSNTSLPTDTTKWRKVVPISPFPVGCGMDYHLSTLPVAGGWIWADGGTIGNAASGGTNRANADTEALFLALWASQPNSTLPIYTSAGAVSTRGISAAADYAANKRLTVPDKRGRVSAGMDNMGGTAANRLTLSGSGIAGDSLGASGGAQNVTLTASQLPATISLSFKFASENNGASDAVTTGGFMLNSNGTQTTDASARNFVNSGGDQAHNNTQPTLICNYIIKL
jgi:microcystin-dependent protein